MIKFIDLNERLVNKVKHSNLGIEAIHGDIFDYPGIIVSASNPDFTCGGGLDYWIAQEYPLEAAVAKETKNEMKRTEHVIWTITVGRNLDATPVLVKAAFEFALKQIEPGETLLLSGLGTGIGGLNEEEFVKILKEAISEIPMQ